MQHNAMKFATLIGWLEKQPSDKTYRYELGDRCLLAQYFTDMGFKKVIVDPYKMLHMQDEISIAVPLPKGFNAIAFTLSGSDRTYGGALARTQRWMESSNVI